MRILLIGNSIVAAMFTNGAVILQAGGHTVESIAVSGNTSADQKAAWLACAQRGDATVSVAVIQVGINDVQTGVAAAACIANVEAMRADMRTQNPGMKIVLCRMLPARANANVAPRYDSTFVPINAAYDAAGAVGAAIGEVDAVMDNSNIFFDVGDGYADPTWFNPDLLHPLVDGNRRNAWDVRQVLNTLFGLTDQQASNGTANPGRRNIIGYWQTTNIPANFNAIVNRASLEKSAQQASRSCRLTRVMVSMDDANLANPAAGSPLLVKAIRTLAAGYSEPPKTIASVAVGESNIARDPLTTFVLSPGDSVHIQLTTDASWTGTTCDPSVSLEFTE